MAVIVIRQTVCDIGGAKCSTDNIVKYRITRKGTSRNFALCAKHESTPLRALWDRRVGTGKRSTSGPGPAVEVVTLADIEARKRQ